MRKLIEYLLEKVQMPETFDELRADERVQIGAVALQIPVEQLAMEIVKKRFTKTKTKEKKK
jgi:hypothetical protein